MIELIYDTLDPDVAAYLKANEPEPGVHWHRQLTENIGVWQLVSRCYEVIGMAKTCEDIHELRQRVAQHYGKKPVLHSILEAARSLGRNVIAALCVRSNLRHCGGAIGRDALRRSYFHPFSKFDVVGFKTGG